MGRRSITLDDAMAQTRSVGPEENSKLLELMGHVPMEGSLVLSTRRDPDFFALYTMQRGSHEVTYYEDDECAAMGAMLVRDGFVDGVAQPVGYLGDLRMSGMGRARAFFPVMYGKRLDELRAKTGCSAFFTAILADNALALASLTKRKEKRRALPFYAHMRDYQMASIQVLAPPKIAAWIGGSDSGGARIDVTRAVDGDVDALAAFLHTDHRTRPFGYRFDDGELQHRLAHWPGFSLADTFVARAGDGSLLGCATAWDPSPVKRYRVMRYGGAMRFLRAGMTIANAALDCPAMPPVGGDFRTLYLTNLSIKGDDPLILRALLRAIYPHAWQQRAHFVALPLWGADDPHARALGGYLVQRLAFQLFGVTPAEIARSEWPAGRPGFEIALA